jgi:formylglycine-generating enzyme required for sulfatase activity
MFRMSDHSCRRGSQSTFDLVRGQADVFQLLRRGPARRPVEGRHERRDTMIGFVIAVLMCSGSNCEMVQAEPGVSYPSYEACNAALETKAASLNELARQKGPAGRPSTIVCLNQPQSIMEVEEPFEVLDTAIVHAEPSATSTYVGLVEKGQRTLATGVVSGTQWLRVLLPDGKTGFVFGDRLRKIGGNAQTGPKTNELATPQLSQGTEPATTSTSVSPVQSLAAGQTESRPENPGLAQGNPSTQGTLAGQQGPRAAALNSVPAPTARSLRSNDFRDCDTCPVMITLPAGTFSMGSNADSSERPPHLVHVGPFAIGKFELTRAEWDTCVTEGGCRNKPPLGELVPERQPMANLSWDDAAQYVQWLAKRTSKPYRLPSEAEWEYAARGGASSRYSWGDQVGTGKASCNGCGGPRDPLHPPAIAMYAPNAWDLHDMQGGVAEWVEDCWHNSYQGASTDGSAWRSPSCSKHVLRGGSWNNPATDVTVSSRNFYDSNVRYFTNGVRVALTLH